jgi:hypothetical protein
MDLMVIGFSGRPVLAATGWKPPILYDEKTDCAFLEASTSDTWTMADVRRFEQECLLSLLPNRIPVKEGGRVVYAHDMFIRPQTDDSPVLAFESLEYVPHLESYVTLLTETEALDLYRQWAQQLVESARRALGDSAERALARAMRARHCTVPAPLHGLRREAFALTFAALAVLDRPTEPLLEDAKMDFSDIEIATIKRKGTASATEASRVLATDYDLKGARRGPPRSKASAA